MPSSAELHERRMAAVPRGIGHATAIYAKRAKNAEIWSEDGKRYIDFNSGWCVGNLGWNRKEIQSKINLGKIPDYIMPGYYYQRWADLAELLASIAPVDLQKSIRATGGTEAVEAAMQLAMLYTGREKFLSIEDSYHGN